MVESSFGQRLCCDVTEVPVTWTGTTNIWCQERAHNYLTVEKGFCSVTMGTTTPTAAETTLSDVSSHRLFSEGNGVTSKSSNRENNGNHHVALTSPEDDPSSAMVRQGTISSARFNILSTMVSERGWHERTKSLSKIINENMYPHGCQVSLR